MKLYNRETSYYTIITIPKCLVSKYGKKQIWRSLNTKDYKLAKLRAELETMSIRRKLLNDLNKQKEKTSKALDFAQILDDDDDDFFEDDIDIKDTVDFSHYTEEEFAKLDDFYAMANKLITGMPQFNGYIAQVGLACAEKDGPYRGAGFYIKFNGIEKIYSAHRDTGHGYGIEIKIK